MSEDGYLLDPMYFFVEGNVVVSKNNDGSLSVEVNACNSYGIPVHIVYNPSEISSVEDTHTSVEVCKQIRNGQLHIQRNGNTYNVLGTVVN